MSQNKFKVLDLNVTSLEAGDFQSCIGLGDNLGPDFLLKYALDHNLKQIVQKSNLDTEKAMNTSTSMLHAPESFLLQPLCTIFDPLNSSPKREAELQQLHIEFNSSDDKERVMEAVEKFVGAVTSSRTLLSDVCLVVDELFSNAVYNAPFVDHDNSRSGVSRELKSLVYPAGKKGEIFIGVQDQRLVLGCADPFGTLNIAKLLNRIRNCYEKGTREMMNWGEGGAGIGSYMIFQTCSNFYAGVKKDVRTVICCGFPLGMSGKARESLPKNLHVF